MTTLSIHLANGKRQMVQLNFPRNVRAEHLRFLFVRGIKENQPLTETIFCKFGPFQNGKVPPLTRNVRDGSQPYFREMRDWLINHNAAAWKHGEHARGGWHLINRRGKFAHLLTNIYCHPDIYVQEYVEPSLAAALFNRASLPHRMLKRPQNGAF